MKSIKCDLPNLEQVEIHPLSDFHLGDAMCDFKLIREKLDYIAANDKAFCILGGDLMDAAIASSVGDTYGANLQPMEQLKQCVELFEPIKDKILCVLSGNHEARTYKSDGIDMTALMCSQLGIPEAYSPTTALLFVRFGHSSHRGRPICYTVYVTHGAGGGRKEGGKINRLADLAGIVDSDVYIHSHTHMPAILREGFYRTDMTNSTATMIDRLFVNTAATLDYGGYGDVQGYKPASKTNPVIIFDGRHKRMRAVL